MSDNKKAARLQAMRATLNEAIDNEIEMALRKEKLSEARGLSFFRLTDVFNECLPSLMEEADGNRIIKSFVKTIKASKPLSKAYSVNRVVKEGKGISSKETMAMICERQLSEISGRKLSEDTLKLADVVCEALDESGMGSDEIGGILNATDTPVNGALSYMAENTSKSSNMIEWSNSLGVLKENISERPAESVSNLKEMICTLEDILGDSERPKWEKEAIFEVVSAVLLDTPLNEVFETCKNACLMVIEENAEKKGIEEKITLDEMKGKLNTKEYNASTFLGDILSMSELAHIITEGE